MMEPISRDRQEGLQRNYNLDLIKAICIILVLIWHLQPFDISLPNVKRFAVGLIFKEAQIALYFQVALTAVPTFLITSQYLYFQKLEQYGYSYFFKRMRTLLYVTAFWMTLQFIFYYYIEPLTSPGMIPAPLPSSIPAWLQLIMIGGPFQQNSAFYFLTTLIMLTAFSTLFMIVCRSKWLGILLGSLIILVSLAYFQIQQFTEGDIAYWQMRNFILYAPIAYFIYAYGGKLTFTVKSALWLIYFILCFQDLQLRHAGLQFNLYGRASVAVGATALVCSLINIKNIRESRVINFLSTHSLGIFALHLYIYYFLAIHLLPLLIAVTVRKKTPIWEFRINFQVLGMGLATILLTLLCVYILGKTPLRKFVT